jgi:hypothetical protein
MEAYGEDRPVARANARRLVERLVRLERAFFEQVGVDGYICWVGKMPPHRAPDYYTLPVADMARFGVTHVVAPPGYPDRVLDGLDVDLVRVDLGERD